MAAGRTRQAISILGLTALIAGTMALVAPAASAATIYTDEFPSLTGWTATRITLDTAIGSPTAPSARPRSRASPRSPTETSPPPR